jgi:hypothetical protein
MTGPFFATLAGLAGAAQTVMLARSVGHPSLLGSFLVRYALVAAVLVVAALAGQIFWAAAGWAVGFGAAAVITHRRMG